MRIRRCLLDPEPVGKAEHSQLYAAWQISDKRQPRVSLDDRPSIRSLDEAPLTDTPNLRRKLALPDSCDLLELPITNHFPDQPFRNRHVLNDRGTEHNIEVRIGKRKRARIGNYIGSEAISLGRLPDRLRVDVGDKDVRRVERWSPVESRAYERRSNRRDPGCGSFRSGKALGKALRPFVTTTCFDSAQQSWRFGLNRVWR